MDSIVGILWNRNEGDILEEIIEEALTKVDSLFIADDGSTDNSWGIIQSVAKRRPDKIEYTRNHRDDPDDKGQRQALLSEVKRRYKPENTWVQIIESDIMVLDTDIRKALARYAVEDMAMSWSTLNAVRLPGTWGEVDSYPSWAGSIKEIMPLAHWMEIMLYTFRPLPEINYFIRGPWRPWPQGWTNYTSEPNIKRSHMDAGAPLLAHYGYRGPTHFYLKFKEMAESTEDGHHRKYKTWDLRSPEAVERTVSFFNGEWNRDLFFMSRGGWLENRKWCGGTGPRPRNT